MALLGLWELQVTDRIIMHHLELVDMMENFHVNLYFQSLRLCAKDTGNEIRLVGHQKCEERSIMALKHTSDLAPSSNKQYYLVE